MTPEFEFSDDQKTFVQSQQFQDIKSSSHEHLLTRIEELGAEFGRWSRTAIRQFVELELDGFVRMQRIPINDRETQLIAEALTKELAGFGPLEDLLNDPAVEDIDNVTFGSPADAERIARIVLARSSGPGRDLAEVRYP